MNNQRYRALLSYLPGMAAVVNMFQSPDVQQRVYDELIQALDAKLDGEGAGSQIRGLAKELFVKSNGDLAHDLAEGANIHADLPRM